MEELPSNSRRPRPREDIVEPQRETRPRIEKIVTGKVVKHKPTIMARLREQFGGADGKSVFDYIVMDMIIPTTKTMFEEAFNEAIHRMLNPNLNSDRDRHPSVRRNRFNPHSYRGVDPREEPYHTPYNRPTPRGMTSAARRTHNFDGIVLESRSEADNVLDEMRNMLEKYGNVSVRDLYELVGEESMGVDDSFGWYDLHYAKPIRTNGGWLLDLPKPDPLN